MIRKAGTRHRKSDDDKGSSSSIVHLLPLSHLTPGLRDLGADVLLPVLALLHKHGVALLGLHLLPLDGEEGGHVHTELLVVEVHGVAVRVTRRPIVCCPPLYQVLTGVVGLQLFAATERKPVLKYFGQFECMHEFLLQ